MQAFKHFHDDWLDYSVLEGTTSNNTKIEYLRMNLGIPFFDQLSFQPADLKEYRYLAAKSCAETLGDRPALCISGGVDSQAMVQCFHEFGYNYDVYCLTFNNDLNIHDVSYARKFAERNNFKLNEINIDILNFLTRENLDYAVRYNCSSPHFNTHFKLFDILRSKGYTSVVCGGNVPTQTLESDGRIIWGGGYGRNTLSFIKYSKISGFLAQGCFLSYHPRLAWATALLTPITEYFRPHTHMPWEEKLLRDKSRYDDKCMGYKRAGFDIITQETKYTGFELVKKHYADQTGDGWVFERRFRYPLEKLLHKDKFGLPEIYIDEQMQLKLDELYRKNLLPRRTPSGI